jgi:AcrR family transcriptional regulator
MPKTGMTPEEIQEKALSYAMTRIRQVGFKKVRLVDIAKDLGVSHVALYKHFADKSALLDKVSECWLTIIDEELHRISQSDLPSLEKVEAWFLKLHRLKREKVLHDPELYEAFNAAAESKKSFVRKHLENMHTQLLSMVQEAMVAKQLNRANTSETIVLLLIETTLGFHHPRLVLEFLAEDRELLLKKTLNIVFQGLAP